MMILIIIIGLLEAAVGCFLMMQIKKRASQGNDSADELVNDKLAEREAAREKINTHYRTMVELPIVRQSLGQIRELEETLKSERGRVAITQAELETVENRLRELEELERELEASGLETKEEVNILRKKESDLAAKNDKIKAQIAASLAEMNEIMGQMQLSAEMSQHVEAVQVELLQTEEKINVLFLQVEQGNEQYVILKQRYDALDIEYAQLYEKFSESEQYSQNKKAEE